MGGVQELDAVAPASDRSPVPGTETITAPDVTTGGHIAENAAPAGVLSLPDAVSADPAAAPSPSAGATDASADPESTVAAGEASPAAAAPFVRYKKRKVALYVSYLGHEYSGMQRNPGVRTVEGELFAAIHKAGGISTANSDDEGFKKLHWMRVARTDRGVSAVGQVVSFQMMLQPEGMLERINVNLPADIRALGYGRVTSGFDARKHCDARRYEYVLPTWVFDPAWTAPEGLVLGPRVGTATRNGEGRGGGQDGQDSAAEPEKASEDVPGAGSGPEAALAAEAGGGGVDEAVVAPAATAAATSSAPLRAPTSATAAPSTYRLSSADTARLSQILSAYVGTHNYHNFTPSVDANSASARRFIRSFKCEGTFEIDGEPWVKLAVVGQSFMLNQIRIMVGLAIAIARGLAPADAIETALSSRRTFRPPMAPALGLYLDTCYYDAYNLRFGGLHGELKMSDRHIEMETFKRERLHPSLLAIDRRDAINAAWLGALLEDKDAWFHEWKLSPEERGQLQEYQAKRERKDRWAEEKRNGKRASADGAEAAVGSAGGNDDGADAAGAGAGAGADDDVDAASGAATSEHDDATATEDSEGIAINNVAAGATASGSGGAPPETTPGASAPGGPDATADLAAGATAVSAAIASAVAPARGGRGGGGGRRGRGRGGAGAPGVKRNWFGTVKGSSEGAGPAGGEGGATKRSSGAVVALPPPQDRPGRGRGARGRGRWAARGSGQDGSRPPLPADELSD